MEGAKLGMFSSLFGGGGSAKRAAQAAADKAAEGAQLVKDQYALQEAKYAPYQQAGQQAITDYNTTLGNVQNRINALDPKIANLYSQQDALKPQVEEMYGLSKQMDPVIQEILGGGQNFTTSPGYEFRLAEGQKALERSRAANGTLNSGATGKALLEYGQGIGSQEYGNYMNSLYNQLSAVNTQLGGRSTALTAGQNQVVGGLNLLGADMNQISAEQNLANQYQALINMGYSAADASAQMGMNAAGYQANSLANQGEIYASGMMAKDKQMQAAGDQWIQLGAMAAGGLMGGAGMLGGAAGGAAGAAGGLSGGAGAMRGAQIFGGMANQLTGGGQSTPQYLGMNYGNQLGQGTNIQAGAKQATTSGFAPSRYAAQYS